MFAANTYLKIIGYLNLDISSEVEVKAALAMAEAKPELEIEVEEILNQLAELQAQLHDERSSPNSAMIRADVVEWEGGGARTAGFKSAANELKSRLSRLLGLTWNRSSGSSQGTISFPTRTVW